MMMEQVSGHLKLPRKLLSSYYVRRRSRCVGNCNLASPLHHQGRHRRPTLKQQSSHSFPQVFATPAPCAEVVKTASVKLHEALLQMYHNGDIGLEDFDAHNFARPKCAAGSVSSEACENTVSVSGDNGQSMRGSKKTSVAGKRRKATRVQSSEEEPYLLLLSESFGYAGVTKIWCWGDDLMIEITVKLGYGSNTFLGNHLLRMYACGGGRETRCLHVVFHNLCTC